MRKIFAIMIAGTMATAGVAFAQTNPPGSNVPPNTPGVGMPSKAQAAAEAKKSTRKPGVVAPAGGDITKTPEGGAIGTDRGAIAGEKRAETRDQRRPGKAPTMQGGTPK